jgi:hypothetical protein
MKCISCGTDNTLKDRTDHYGACKACRQPFVFEPTKMGSPKITDPMFAKAIIDLSVNNTLFFTPKQFLYFLDARLRRKSAMNSKKGWIGLYLFFVFLSSVLSRMIIGPSSAFWAGFVISAIFTFSMFRSSQSAQLSAKQRQAAAESLPILGFIILALGIFLSILQESILQFNLSLLLGSCSIYLGFRQSDHQRDFTQKFLIEPNQLQDWLNRWQQVIGPLTQLLPAPQAQLAPAEINPELSAYSFDRLVVCQSAAIAQLLIANQFHFEHNCAILSITGYPENIFDTTLEMVRRNPDLKVYAFHDCSAQGIRLVHQLKHSPQWFQNSAVAITDVGLSPRQVLATQKGMFIQRSPGIAQDAKQQLAEIRGDLLATELNWLESGSFVELESFTPQKLIQILHRSISETRDPASEDGSDLFFVGDSGGYFYTSESFG